MEIGPGIDFKAAPLVASFFGAMAYGVLLRVKNPWQLAGIVFIGMTTSYFVGPLVADQISRLGFGNVSLDGIQNAAGFVSGLTGMAICNGIIALAKKFQNTGKPEGETPNGP